MITDKMLEENTTPWGLLSVEMMEAFSSNRFGDLEYYAGSGDWKEVTFWSRFDDKITVRKKPTPLTKPDIPWEFIKEEYKWAARSAEGLVFAYTQKPDMYSHCCWTSVGISDCRLIDTELWDFDPGTCDWKDSLVERPK